MDGRKVVNEKTLTIGEKINPAAQKSRQIVVFIEQIVGYCQRREQMPPPDANYQLIASLKTWPKTARPPPAANGVRLSPLRPGCGGAWGQSDSPGSSAETTGENLRP